MNYWEKLSAVNNSVNLYVSRIKVPIIIKIKFLKKWKEINQKSKFKIIFFKKLAYRQNFKY